VNTVMACGNCHTPKDSNGLPTTGKELSGGAAFDLPPFAATAANITPDRETGIGTWSEDDIKRALIVGVRPEHARLPGAPLAAIMPANFYKALTAEDLDAVVAYLRSIPAVKNEVPSPVYKMPVMRGAYTDAEKQYTSDSFRDPATRGRYLATIGHCMECHTPMMRGAPDFANSLGKGGRVFSPTGGQRLAEYMGRVKITQYNLGPEGWSWVVDRCGDQASHYSGNLARWNST
jgi:mono/diheme cytochrome c family protein